MTSAPIPSSTSTEPVRQDSTCYIDRSKVREAILGRRTYEDIVDLLVKIDALPIFTAGDFSHGAQAAGGCDETAWLIEQNDPPVYVVLTDDFDDCWTPDASKALRFARRQDAQAYADHIGWTSPPVRVAEHMWPAVPQPASNAGGSQATLKMVAGMFAESVHETYTREEVVSIVEDMMRVGCPDPASEAGGCDDLKLVYVKRWRTIVRLPARYADEIVESLRVPIEPSPLEWLAQNSNYELTYSGWDEDPAWQLHSVSGGRNDREWTLRFVGKTPDEVLRKAMASTLLSTERDGGAA